MSESELLVPPDAILVHIGPYKTGSTLIQMSLHNQRAALAEHGVSYPGEGQRPVRPVAGLLGWSERGRPAASRKDWDDFAAKVREIPGRVCISNEFLASASTDQVGQLLDDLGADRVHMVLVARRLDKLLPSAWQERVKSVNETRGYPDWLATVIEQAPGPRSSLADIRRLTFWRNHSMAALLGSWAALPPERLTVVVADESDRTLLPRTFEGLLGVPPGTLASTARGNKSLSWDQTELLRLVNLEFDKAGWSDAARRRLLHYGMVEGLRQAGAGDVALPQLSAEQAAQIAALSAQRITEIEASGARVIGELGALMPSPTDAEPAQGPQTIAIDTAASAVAGLVTMALKDQQSLSDRLQRAEAENRTLQGQASTPLPVRASQIPRRALGKAGRVVRRGRQELLNRWRSE